MQTRARPTPAELARPVARLLIAPILVAALVTTAACATRAPRPQGPSPAEIVPRADNIGMNLTIDRLDGRIVNVPEATMLEIPPGPRRLGVKVEYKPTSAGALVWGLGVIATLAREAGAEAAHLEVEFTAEPGRRYHLNGDMEDGEPRIWVVDDQTKEIVSF